MAGNSWFNHNECLQSCALSGAAAMAAGITDAYIVANGPTWCYFYAMKVTDRPGLNLGQRFLCTYPTNGAIVFGTEKEVLQTLADLTKLPKAPGLVLVENSCAFSLIGDDLSSIVGESDLTCPILTMDSGGTLGDFWAGYRKALFDLLKLVDFQNVENSADTKKNGKFHNEERDLENSNDRINKSQYTVNLIGCSVTYYNEIDDLAELERLLKIVGIDVNLILAVDHNMADLKRLPEADLNVVIHSELGHEAAEWLLKKLDMPYVEPVLPYGLEGTLTWIREILLALMSQAGTSTTQSVEAMAMIESHEFDEKQIELSLKPLSDFIQSEKARQFERTKDIQRLCGEPWFDSVIISAPSSIVKGMERAFNEEWLDAGQFIYVIHDDSKDKPDYYFYVQGHDWQAALQTGENSLLLGSDQERRLCVPDKHIAYQTISNPEPAEVVLAERPFMGINGHRNMQAIIWNLYIHSLEKSGVS